MAPDPSLESFKTTNTDSQRENEYYRKKIKEQQEAIDLLSTANDNAKDIVASLGDDVRRAAQVLWCVIRKGGGKTVTVTDDEMNMAAEPGNHLESFYHTVNHCAVFSARKPIVEVKH